MITLSQLEAQYGAEVLLEVASKLQIDLKDFYSPDSEEFLALQTEIKSLRTSTTSSASTTPGSDEKQGSGSTEVRRSQAKATAKRLNEQAQAQGAMVTGEREATQAILKTERNNGIQLATVANREFTRSFLQTRSQGLTEFAASYAETTDIFLEVADQEYLACEDETDPLEQTGGFTLQSFIRQESRAQLPHSSN